MDKSSTSLIESLFFQKMFIEQYYILVLHLISNSLLHSTGNGCDLSDKPLMLSPLLENNETEKARSLSEVNYDYLEVDIPTSYAGYITVDKKLGNHLFFWHFVSEKNVTAPLLLWLNGGPTLSSMLGLFHENGPLELIREDHLKVTYRRRKYSWTRSFAMLYVDNPVNTGFSFSDSGENGDRFDESGITHDLYNFMVQFLFMFPEYKSGEIYFGGQSYAGTYITSLAHYIHEQNKNYDRRDEYIPFTGIHLGGPYLDIRNQITQHADFLFHIGVHGYGSYLKHKQDIEDQLSFWTNLTKEECTNFTLHDFFVAVFTPQSKHNFATQEVAPENLVEKVMNSFFIKRAVHAGIKRIHKTFNDRLNHKFLHDALQSRLERLAVLLDNYKVLIYNGALDAVMSSAMIEESLIKAPWSKLDSYRNSKRIPTYLNSDKLQAYYSFVGKFCRVVVSGAGHQVPYDQPKTMIRVIENFVEYGCIHQ